jgi:hypothetical protein
MLAMAGAKVKVAYDIVSEWLGHWKKTSLFAAEFLTRQILFGFSGCGGQ